MRDLEVVATAASLRSEVNLMPTRLAVATVLYSAICEIPAKLPSNLLQIVRRQAPLGLTALHVLPDLFLGWLWLIHGVLKSYSLKRERKPRNACAIRNSVLLRSKAEVFDNMRIIFLLRAKSYCDNPKNMLKLRFASELSLGISEMLIN